MRRVDFCVNDRVAGPETDASNGGNEYAVPASGLGEVVYGSAHSSLYLGEICVVAGGSLATGRDCAVAVVIGDNKGGTSSAVVGAVRLVVAVAVPAGSEVGG